MALKRTYGRILFTRKEKKGFSSCALALNVVYCSNSVASDVNGRVFWYVHVAVEKGGFPPPKGGFP